MSEQHDVATADISSQRVRILVAEDNIVNQKVMLGILRKLGYRGEAVTNGAEAVEAVLREAYGLVLMDCQMPEVDGYEATRRIRALAGQAARVPIIAVTANTAQGDRQACLDAGMDDYLPKPVTPAGIAVALERWLNRHAAAPCPGVAQRPRTGKPPSAERPRPES